MQEEPLAILASISTIPPLELLVLLAQTSMPIAISATTQLNALNATTDITLTPPLISAWLSLLAQSPIAHSAPINQLIPRPAHHLPPAPTE
jgi:predicted permease